MARASTAPRKGFPGWWVSWTQGTHEAAENQPGTGSQREHPYHESHHPHGPMNHATFPSETSAKTSSRLAGKTALVTGAARGIGRAIARRLAADGALVAINFAGNVAAASELIEQIKSAGGDAFAVQAQIGSAAETAKLFSGLDAELSHRDRRKFDILVNNAGAALVGKVAEMAEADFDRLFATNVKGTFLVTQSALPRLADGGRIINISSGASRRPGTTFGVYAMTKSAIDAMTLALAAELGGRRITVNTVAPGWIITEGSEKARQNAETVRRVESQTALGRLGTPEDIADVVAFLASDESRWVTGQYLEASGGLKLL